MVAHIKIQLTKLSHHSFGGKHMYHAKSMNRKPSWDVAIYCAVKRNWEAKQRAASSKFVEIKMDSPRNRKYGKMKPTPVSGTSKPTWQVTTINSTNKMNKASKIFLYYRTEHPSHAMNFNTNDIKLDLKWREKEMVYSLRVTTKQKENMFEWFFLLCTCKFWTKRIETRQTIVKVKHEWKNLHPIFSLK